MGKNSAAKNRRAQAQKAGKLPSGPSVPPTPTSANVDPNKPAEDDIINNSPERTSTPGYMTPPTSPSTPSREHNTPISNLALQIMTPILNPTSDNTGTTTPPPVDEASAKTEEVDQEENKIDQQNQAIVESEPPAERTQADVGITIIITPESQSGSTEQENSSLPSAEDQLVDVGAGEPPVPDVVAAGDNQATPIVSEPPKDDGAQDQPQQTNGSPDATDGINEGEQTEGGNNPNTPMDPPSSAITTTQGNQPQGEVTDPSQSTVNPILPGDSSPDVSPNVADAGITTEETIQPHDAESGVPIQDSSSEINDQGTQDPAETQSHIDEHGLPLDEEHKTPIDSDQYLSHPSSSSLEGDASEVPQSLTDSEGARQPDDISGQTSDSSASDFVDDNETVVASEHNEHIHKKGPNDTTNEHDDSSNTEDDQGTETEQPPVEGDSAAENANGINDNPQSNDAVNDDPKHEQALTDEVADDEQTPTERRNSGSTDLLLGEPEQSTTAEVVISSGPGGDDSTGHSTNAFDNQLHIIVEQPEDEAQGDVQSPYDLRFTYTPPTPRDEYEGDDEEWYAARYNEYRDQQQQEASTEMQQLRADTSSDISAKDLASPDLLAVADLFSNMKNALAIMTDAFDRLGPQTEKVASYGQDVKAAEQLQRIRSTLEAQILRHKSQVDTLKSTLREKVREATEAKIREQLQDVIRSSIQATVEERVRQELAVQIPEDLRKQVISHKRQLLEVRASLHNSEARRYNALQTMPDLNAPLRPLLRPLPTPEQSPVVITISRSSSMGQSTLATPATAFPQGPAPTPIRRTLSNSFRPMISDTVPPSPSPFFPRDMTSLFALNAEETKRLLREYGLTSAVASPATEHPARPRSLSIVDETADEDAAEEDTETHARDLNAFMAHIGVPFLMIPAPKDKHHESAPLSSRSRRKLLTPLIIK